MYCSLFTGLAFFLPLPVFGTTLRPDLLHVLQNHVAVRIKRDPRVSSLWLFRTLISTCEFVRMLCNKREGARGELVFRPPSLSSMADIPGGRRRCGGLNSSRARALSRRAVRGVANDTRTARTARGGGRLVRGQLAAGGGEAADLRLCFTGDDAAWPTAQ